MKLSTFFSIASIGCSVAVAGLSFLVRDNSLVSWTILVLGLSGAAGTVGNLIMSKREARRNQAIINAAGHSMLGGL
jgi:hypothetical protein